MAYQLIWYHERYFGQIAAILDFETFGDECKIFN